MSGDGETRAAARDASSWVLRHKIGDADGFDVTAVGIVAAPFPDNTSVARIKESPG